MLPDQRRLHMHDGPIDLIVQAFGEFSKIESAYRAAGDRFVSVLDELCEELTTLRQPWRHDLAVHGAVARRMVHVYHSDGGGCRGSRRGDSCIDDSERAAFESLCE